MPLARGVTTPIFLASLVSQGNLGISAPKLAAGLAAGLSEYASGPLQVISKDIGTLGVGSGQGLGMRIPPPVLIAAMVGSFGSQGIAGIMSVPTATGVALGLVSALSQARIQTVSPAVGAGTGIASLVPNGASVGIFIRAFQSAGLTGIQSANMATAVAKGFDIAAPSAVASLVIVGPPNAAPSGGTGIGKLS